MFPLKCIEIVATPHPGTDIPDLGLPPRAPIGEGKLLFTMVPPQQALEIIHNMPAYRRVQYFEQIGGAPTSGGSSPNLVESGSQTSFGGGDQADELDLDSERERRPSRAALNWQRLRSKVLETNLEKGYKQWEDGKNRTDYWEVIARNYVS